MISIDARLSKGLADAAQRYALSRKLADMCATQLLWFMAGGFGLVLYYLSKAVVHGLMLRLVLGVALSWIVTVIVEYALRRRRPFQAQGKRLGIEMLWVPPSFPSGHATISFAIAAAAHALQDSTLFWIAVGMAVLISLGRVAVRVHYLTDVLAGAAVGVVVTSFVIQHL